MLDSLCFPPPSPSRRPSTHPPTHTKWPPELVKRPLRLRTSPQRPACEVFVAYSSLLRKYPRTAESFRSVVTSIRYIGAAECNRGWCSSAPGVHPQLNASHLARQCARGLIFFFTLYEVGMPPRSCPKTKPPHTTMWVSMPPTLSQATPEGRPNQDESVAPSRPRGWCATATPKQTTPKGDPAEVTRLDPREIQRTQKMQTATLAQQGGPSVVYVICPAAPAAEELPGGSLPKPLYVGRCN